MTNEKAQISHNGIKLKDQYQGDDYTCEVIEIINHKLYSKVTIQSLCKRAKYIFVVYKNENIDWLAHDFAKVEKKSELDNNAQSWMWMCGE